MARLRVGARLARAVSCRVPYHPNYGESADAPAIATFHDYVSHYQAFFDALRLDSFHLVGASLGARLAAEFAVSHSDRLRSLVLVSPTGVTTPGVPEVDYATIAPTSGRATSRPISNSLDASGRANRTRSGCSARAREGQATGRALGSSVEAELRKDLQRIRVPTLLIWGRDDRMVPAAHAKTWQALIPDSKVEIIERAGHLLLDESVQARETVARFMREQKKITLRSRAMTLPPGVSPADFTAALKAFEAAVGKDWVFTSDEDVALYRDAYSQLWDEPDERQASAAVAPSSVEEVQAVMRAANRYRIPIYPISTGRNLGYGGSAPALSGSVVLDLKRMNRVLEVSERHAYALVEPGVSYFDLYRHISERGLKVWIDCPDPGWGSLVGNALDRGGGVTSARVPQSFRGPLRHGSGARERRRCCAPAWARCRTRRPGSSSRRASAPRSTASFRNRTSAS